MEIIDVITSKNSWKKKIFNESILNKWANELKNQEIDLNVFYIVILLLRKSYNEKDIFYDDELIIEWPLNINLLETDLCLNCDCRCFVCEQKESLVYMDYEELEEEEKTTYKNCEIFDELKQKNCKCSLLFKKKKNNIIPKYIEDEIFLISEEEKNKLIKNVTKFQNNILIDYHPNSNNQVIDLVHPSLYSYVQKISVIPSDIQMDEKIIFQWLPSEFKIIRKNNLIEKVKILSYINNLNKNKFPEMYDSISEIFKIFVPKFEKVLKNINISENLDECQVIVKLSNTVLTPNNPTFNAGTWHLEGMDYENIVCTGIYYYKIDNITESFLNFRANIAGEKYYYPQDGFNYVKNHYGVSEKTSNNEMNSFLDLGKKTTIEDKCIVFPNFLQHKVSNFELIDKTQSGTRNILVFFLVNPKKKILSTKDIPIQQEIISLEDAKMYRELLMYERKYEIKNQNKFYERTWSLCEH